MQSTWDSQTGAKYIFLPSARTPPPQYLVPPSSSGPSISGYAPRGRCKVRGRIARCEIYPPTRRENAVTTYLVPPSSSGPSNSAVCASGRCNVRGRPAQCGIYLAVRLESASTTVLGPTVQLWPKQFLWSKLPCGVCLKVDASTRGAPLGVRYSLLFGTSAPVARYL